MYESSYKTRQVYTAVGIYTSQAGIVETAIYTGGDSSVDKELKQMAKKISLDWLSDNVQGVSKIGITEEILKRIDGHL